MPEKRTEELVIAELLNEIGIITSGRKIEPDANRSLAENGINSMGFMELLIFIEQHWGVSLMDQGLSARDVSTVQALARCVIKGLEKK